MSNHRLYRFWNDLEEALRSGQPQNESKGLVEGGGFEELYKDPVRLQEFMDAMSGIQMGNFMALVQQFPFDNYETMLDVGGADASLSIQVCRQHPRIQSINYDLAPVKPLAEKKIAQFGLSDRIKVQSGDFFKDPIPHADVITMGNILHGMEEDAKQRMIEKVYVALNDGGAFIVVENIIDNDRRKNTFGLLMSLNMLIENGDAFDYTMNDFEGWALRAGFKKTELIPLTGPTSAAVAHK
jgi:precorrin-6B methylase 2